mmetsp:Transcript_5673/g.10800  ORF Transcript_5673/g.10800 Transcript_5673/m.10800 type:complete len:124 (+) Transcript_5673:703-1074(+)
MATMVLSSSRCIMSPLPNFLIKLQQIGDGVLHFSDGFNAGTSRENENSEDHRHNSTGENATDAHSSNDSGTLLRFSAICDNAICELNETSYLVLSKPICYIYSSDNEEESDNANEKAIIKIAA